METLIQPKYNSKSSPRGRFITPTAEDSSQIYGATNLVWLEFLRVTTNTPSLHMYMGVSSQTLSGNIDRTRPMGDSVQARSFEGTNGRPSMVYPWLPDRFEHIQLFTCQPSEQPLQLLRSLQIEDPSCDPSASETSS